MSFFLWALGFLPLKNVVMTKYSLWGVKKVIQTIKYGFLIDKSRGGGVPDDVCGGDVNALRRVRHLCCTSPGLVFSSRRVGKNSPGLVQGMSWLLLREVRWRVGLGQGEDWRGVLGVGEGLVKAWWMLKSGCWVVKRAFCAVFTLPSRALYTHSIPCKKHSPLHRPLVFHWFSAETVWRFGFSSIHTCSAAGAARRYSRERLVNARWMLGECLVNARWMLVNAGECWWTLGFPILHTVFCWISWKNKGCVKGWTFFSGENLR